ncbi:DUF833-domain-containing protein [Amylocystis lapponica]|nr:DUF833-domain-containing protein [Amylocystis lapponica]
MCVGFWSLDHPQYALIMCSNRDEFLSRPTTKAHFHSFDNISDNPRGEGSVLSGRDLLAGGTWAGINRAGRIALLTNITEPPGKYGTSRGTLVSSFLLPPSPGTSFHHEVDNIVALNTKFAGFNLLLLSPNYSTDDHGVRRLSFDAMFVTNSGGGGTISARALSGEEKHCGGISNGIDRHGGSEWPKVRHGTRAFGDILECMTEDLGESELAERLFELLSWKSDRPPAGRAELRNTIQVEPLSIPAAQSPDTVADEYYGTRLSTIIMVRRDGSVLCIERDIWTLDSDRKATKATAKDQRVFRFSIQSDDTAVQ